MDSFSSGIKITNYSDSTYTNVKTGKSGVGIFKLQTINIEGSKFNVFYDGGCGDLVCNSKAINRLVTLGRANLELPGPFILTGVGDINQVCKNGLFQIRLPLAEGCDALMSELCMEKVTATLPIYQLNEVEKYINIQWNKMENKGDVKRLPKLSKTLGGDTDHDREKISEVFSE